VRYHLFHITIDDFSCFVFFSNDRHIFLGQDISTAAQKCHEPWVHTQETKQGILIKNELCISAE
jgi:hypothetical protein